MSKVSLKSAATTQTVPFEASMSEIEALVRQIESGELSLEDSVKAYQRGASLVKQCRETLSAVEQQIQVLEGDLLKPFDDGVSAQDE
jgi:exodeoxyribonuclease VII small subunit